MLNLKLKVVVENDYKNNLFNIQNYIIPKKRKEGKLRSLILDLRQMYFLFSFIKKTRVDGYFLFSFEDKTWFFLLYNKKLNLCEGGRFRFVKLVNFLLKIIKK